MSGGRERLREGVCRAVERYELGIRVVAQQ